MHIRESRRDFRQRYRTCTVIVLHKKLQQLFYIDDVDEDLEYISGSLISDDSKWIIADDRYAGAISKDWFMTTTWLNNGIYLGYKDVIVGRMRDNTMYPTVELFNGNSDLIDLIQLENIEIGGMLNAQR